MDNNDFRPVSFYEVKAKIEAQILHAQEIKGVPEFSSEKRHIIILDPAVKPATDMQRRAMLRILAATAAKVIELQPDEGESVKEAIARRIAAIGGNTRYVYLGSQPIEAFGE